MARLLVMADNSWYDELYLTASYSEYQFQRKIKQHVESVFPDYYTVSFHLPIESEQREARKPDLAMIRKDYKDWWIVEVELSYHNLDHVIGQVKVFREGQYNAFRVAPYINENSKKENKEELDTDKLFQMIKFNQPKVLIIVDEQKKEWEEPLLKYDAKLCVFQVYRNTNGFEAYRLNGEYPEVPQEESHCRYHDKISNLIHVMSPGILKINENEEIDINYNGKMCKWKMLKIKDQVYLKAIGHNPIPINYSYVLYKTKNERFILKIN